MQEFCDGMQQFIYGLGKKVLIANYVAVIADNIFDTAGTVEMSIATAWLGAIAYTLQIYFDFSGYSDMAIGLGKMFGFRFPENFNYPYISRSATEFWRRWHISLGSWFRDYVYIPLGGNRVSKARWVGNLLAVWALTGIWHGANWTFLCWGLFYFVLLLAENTFKFTEKLGGVSHIYALVVIILGWTMFRSADISAGLAYIATMFGISSNGIVDDVFMYYLSNGWIILFAGTILASPILKYLEKFSWWKTAEPIISIIIFILSIVRTVGSSYNPFIYFNF